jgi:branched-chain amino acid aminotransferase
LIKVRLAFRDGEFLPYEELTVNIGTHALHYGTSVFEGLRAYWNPADHQSLVFRAAEHYVRLQASARFFDMKLPYSTLELCEVTAELLARSDLRADAYIRPLLFKSGDGVGLWRSGIPDSFVIFTAPMGKYLAEGGIRCCVSQWRRPQGNSAPARAKIGGLYASMALARREAVEAGFDEAITLTSDGRVAEGSAENIFLVIDGRLVTPSLGSDVLAGITRASLIELAADELGLATVERSVNVSELAFANAVFLCGTAAEVTPVVEIDRRPVGDGLPGPVTQRLAHIYEEVVRGARDEHREWLLPVRVESGTKARS